MKHPPKSYPHELLNNPHANFTALTRLRTTNKQTVHLHYFTQPVWPKLLTPAAETAVPRGTERQKRLYGEPRVTKTAATLARAP